MNVAKTVDKSNNDNIFSWDRINFEHQTHQLDDKLFELKIRFIFNETNDF